MKAKLFGTDGIRGQANRYPITPEVALRAGQSIARVLGNTSKGRRKVVIGKDTRISGYMLETALTSGLVSFGMDVLLVGPLPTPAVAHLTKSMGCCAGIMLTASHNPYEDNGLKVFGPDGFKLSDDHEAAIEEGILDGFAQEDAPASSGIGKAFRVDDGKGRYIEYLKGLVGNVDLTGVKVVIDCANGAAYELGPLVLREMGAEVVSHGTAPNGLNINDGCGAMFPEAVETLVRNTGADIGISLDGDADRVIFTDHTGKRVNGDRILCLGALGLRREGRLKHQTLVATTMSNLGLIEALKREGISVEVSGVGDRMVIERMREGGFCFGGENSGHVIFGDHSTTGDGLLTTLKVLSWMVEQKVSLRELANCMNEYPLDLISISVREKTPLDAIVGMPELIQSCDEAFGKDGRSVIRYSGTEKKLRVLLEHRDRELLTQFANQFRTLIERELGV